MLDTTRLIFKTHGGLVSLCFFMVFFSVFGQSVLFGVYLPDIQNDLNLSKSEIGSVYATATILSAILIIYTGKGLDHIPLQKYLTFTLLGLAIGYFVMASVQSVPLLFLAFLILRQCGQGLLPLTANASINRYMTTYRGSAAAISKFGASFHLLIFPVLALSLSDFLSWRETWIAYGVFTLIILLPAFRFSLRNHEEKTHSKWSENIQKDLKAAKEKNSENDHGYRKHWTRPEVLKDWRFYGLSSILLITPFLGTALFFYQSDVATALELTPLIFASSFSFFTFSAIFGSIIGGIIVDKFGEKYVLAIFPLIYSLGLYLFTQEIDLVLTYTSMSLIGCATGMGGILGGVLLAKLYGTLHMGSIRALLFCVGILSSAASPALFGYLLDQGHIITDIFQSTLYYTLAVWVLAFPICKNIKKDH